ncbi:MAG: hypothetical protein ISP90_09075, partial [Nevskia sp.]|nr:hypothetical protein [Nevskia sp.]
MDRGNPADAAVPLLGADVQRPPHPLRHALRHRRGRLPRPRGAGAAAGRLPVQPGGGSRRLPAQALQLPRPGAADRRAAVHRQRGAHRRRRGLLDQRRRRPHQHDRFGFVVTGAWRAPIAPLFVPADRPERFAKAAASGADAVILDLEDAVAPAAKAGARANLAAHGVAGVPVVIRINAQGTADFAADLAALRGASFDAVMLPKAEDAAQVAALHAGLGRQVTVLALVESARGIAGLAPLLAAPGVAQAAFGSLDFALDLGCTPSWEALLMARSQLVLYSKLAGLAPPLDGVTTSLDDAALVEAEA